MDITAIFKSCVETLRQQNKELAYLNPPDKHVSSQAKPKPKIFPAKKSEYYAHARELSVMITTLRDFLHENRSPYLNISGSATAPKTGSVFVGSGSGGRTKSLPTMSDIERDQIDNDVQKIAQNCQRRILEYEKMIETTETIQSNPNLRIHMESVADSLTIYLKEVTVLFSEMRAVRVKRTVDYQTMSRLSTTSSLSNSSRGFGFKSKSDSNSASSQSDRDKEKEKLGKRSSLDVHESETDGHSPGTQGTASGSVIPNYFLEDEPIPPEELQMLEEENAGLLNELNSIAQEVDQIQSNVVQIAQLQEIFTEKVLLQEKEIDLIANVVVGTTENIKGGNEQIRQAIQKNADFRAWVLFFILVMSFSLLFLDWYNE